MLLKLHLLRYVLACLKRYLPTLFIVLTLHLDISEALSHQHFTLQMQGDYFKQFQQFTIVLIHANIDEMLMLRISIYTPGDNYLDISY